MSDFLPKTERRNLRHDFTATETHDLSLELAAKTRELAAVKEEKKSATAQYTAKEKEIQALLGRLSNQITDGWEFRERVLDIEYHKPEQGRKTLTDPETGKTIVERMTDYEFNLFNQPKDDEDKEDDPSYNAAADPDSDQYDSVRYGPREAKKVQKKGVKKKTGNRKADSKGTKKKDVQAPSGTNEPTLSQLVGGEQSTKSRKKLTDLAAEVKANAGIVEDNDPLGINTDSQQAF